jgi:hypothetical protein
MITTGTGAVSGGEAVRMIARQTNVRPVRRSIQTTFSLDA